MKLKNALSLPVQNVRRSPVFFAVLISIAVGAALYPSDMNGTYSYSKGGQGMPLVTGVEDYGRHVNTVVPFGAALILRDWGGIRQLATITIAGIAATHGPKRALNNVTINGTRLGQRPSSPDSNHNMPSGHSSLASAGAYYAMRRYSIWLGLLTIPVMLLTMYARYMLDAHTVSAVIAGAATGILIAALFSSKQTQAAPPNQL
ncbi:MAG: phosphatase PAP2 family protein [Thalassovita sp.]